MRFVVANPKDKEKRIIRRFAWLFETVIDTEDNITRVWLEFYEIEQEFQAGQDYKPRYWEDLSKKLIKRK